MPGGKGDKGVETSSVELVEKQAMPEAVLESKTTQEQAWSPEQGPHLIELSVTASHVGGISTMEETCNARLWVDVYWLPSAEELAAPQNGPQYVELLVP